MTRDEYEGPIVRVPKQVYDPAEEAAELDAQGAVRRYDLRRLPNRWSLHIATANSLFVVARNGDTMILATNSKALKRALAEAEMGPLGLKAVLLPEDHCPVVLLGSRWRFSGEATTSRVRSILPVDDSPMYSFMEIIREA
jgi:hypothetical protein